MLVFCTLNNFQAQAQIIYGEGSWFYNNEYYLLRIDLATCTVCPISPELLNTGPSTLTSPVVLPNGNILQPEGSLGLQIFSPPPAYQLINTASGGSNVFFQHAVLSPGGLVYVTAPNGLYSYNPANNQLTFLGAWPAGGYCTHLYYDANGVLRGIWFPNVGGSYFELTVNISNPPASVFGVANPPYYHEPISLNWNGTQGVMWLNEQGNGSIQFFDPATNSSSTICAFSAPWDIYAISPGPPGVPDFPCIDPCTSTNAGNIPGTGPFYGCSQILLPGAVNFDLNVGEVINYILFTDLSDPIGSILATSTGSFFNFNPATMQSGIPYYAAAIAGNHSGGLVFLTDPCLDISDPVTVQFTERPSVSFTVANPDICPGGCQTITAQFTGTPPFTLNANVVAGGATLSTINQTFSANTGNFTVCIPNSVPLGSVQIQAVALWDATCSCF